MTSRQPSPTLGAAAQPAGAPVLPETPAFVEERALANKPKWTETEARAYLDACPRVLVSVPLDPWEEHLPGTRLLNVQWNGHTFGVQKGDMVDVPWPIAEIIRARQTSTRTDQMKERDPLRMMVSAVRPNGLDITHGLGY